LFKAIVSGTGHGLDFAKDATWANEILGLLQQIWAETVTAVASGKPVRFGYDGRVR